MSFNISPFNSILPVIADDVFIADGARIIGKVHIGSKSSIWFNTVVRGDVHEIRIGARTNIQDNTTVHVSEGRAGCYIGNDVTIGHNAIVHACTVEDLALIGMGAVISDEAVIGKGSLVGAGALVTQGKKFPPYSLIIGSPAKAVRQLTEEEIKGLQESADHYVEIARQYLKISDKASKPGT